MLRLTALALVLANLLWFAWERGLMAPWGLAPAQQSEPQRLQQQLRPEQVRLLAADEATRMGAAAAPAAQCLASAPLDEAVAANLRTVLAAWPAGSWSLEPASLPGRWIVYMGPYADAGALERKKAELRQRGVSFEAPANPALEPGLSLGGFPTEAAASQQLATLAARGVRTAKVAQERAAASGLALRLPAVDEALRLRLDELRPALAGQALRACG